MDDDDQEEEDDDDDEVDDEDEADEVDDDDDDDDEDDDDEDDDKELVLCARNSGQQIYEFSVSFLPFCLHGLSRIMRAKNTAIAEAAFQAVYYKGPWPFINRAWGKAPWPWNMFRFYVFFVEKWTNRFIDFGWPPKKWYLDSFFQNLNADVSWES